MKYKVRVEGQLFEVEVGNISVRPIIVTVEGEEYEVWPESLYAPQSTMEGSRKPKQSVGVQPISASTTTQKAEPSSTHQISDTTETKTGLLNVVKAPIPGVITAIMVQPGSIVETGQELCKLEAMKMNNSIRSSRSGKIGSVLVSIGQHVKHNDPLLEFSA